MTSLNPSCPDCTDLQFCDWHRTGFISTDQLAWHVREIAHFVEYEQGRLTAYLRHSQQPGAKWDQFTESNLVTMIRMIRSRDRRLALYRAAIEMRGH